MTALVTALVAAGLSGLVLATPLASRSSERSSVATPQDTVAGYCRGGGDYSQNDQIQFAPRCASSTYWSIEDPPVLPTILYDDPAQFTHPSEGFKLTQFDVTVYAFGPHYGYFVGYDLGTAPEFLIESVAAILVIRFYGECPSDIAVEAECNEFAFTSNGQHAHDEPRTCAENPRYSGSGVNGCDELLRASALEIDDLANLPEPLPAAYSVSVTPSTITAGYPSTFAGTQLSATVVVSLGASPGVTWVSQDSAIASVNASGFVTAAGSGGSTVVCAHSVVDPTVAGCAWVTFSGPLMGAIAGPSVVRPDWVCTWTGSFVGGPSQPFLSWSTSSEGTVSTGTSTLTGIPAYYLFIETGERLTFSVHNGTDWAFAQLEVTLDETAPPDERCASASMVR